MSGEAVRLRARIAGTVQGVGFRPYVYRLARELSLVGWVANDERGVTVEVQGDRAAVALFLERLPCERPPLARVDEVRTEPLPLTAGDRRFHIASFDGSGPAEAAIPADVATCARCLAECLDPADRRHRYPFVNCTDCGPRYTIVTGAPYDRVRTTMAAFEMCAACRAEYEDPADRRFHAQPNACPACGPRARLIDGSGVHLAGDDTSSTAPAGDAVAAAASLLSEGAIVAVKGLGGYHLACRADDEAAVGRLRAAKRREHRPFAVMAGDLAAARSLVEIDDAEAALLEDPARPIMLARRRAGAPVAPSVAPGLPELGVMLPYSALHHLLLADASCALVMTSGNLSDEPIVCEDGDALQRLAPIADALLVHDRPIGARADDSVARVVAGRPALLRRSRGHVPGALSLPTPTGEALLACGADLKSTFSLARDARAWVGPHVGDLRGWEALRCFREAISHHEALLGFAPEAVVCDMHPDYASSAYAMERGSPRTLAVQHHHAHMAAVLAEHGEAGPAVAAVYDGTGYGVDGTIWGGEILVGGLGGFRRAAHLRALAMPGGERAIAQPWRMACAWLREACEEDEPPLPRTLHGFVDAGRWSAVARIAAAGRDAGAPITTSMGRLFDAVAGLCGLRGEVTYEGQAAAELEAAADPTEAGAYAIDHAGGILDPRPAVRELLGDVAAGLPVGTISARFHNGVAHATAHACLATAREADVGVAVLAGGVFQNRRLLETTRSQIEGAGLRVLTAERLPPNDGAISYGQAAVAAATLSS